MVGDAVSSIGSRRSSEGKAVLASVSDAVVNLGLPGASVLVAVSGGVDSTVLADALHRLADDHGLVLSLGHIHHGLRGRESDADQASAEALADRLRVAFLSDRVEPEAAREGHSSRTRPTLQEAARRLRYEALEALRRKAGASVIATAHNADDQAETVLLRLLRGCGPDGLVGIPEVSRGGAVVRPLLRVTRRDILGYAHSAGLSWREDASNLDTGYSRNRLRRDWLPGLARDFNPQLLRTIGNLAEAHQRDAEWMSSLVTAEAARSFERREDGLWIDSEHWRSLPEALARRLIQRALCDLGVGREVTRVHLARVLAFLAARRGTKARQGGRILELPGGVRVARERHMFRLYRVDAKAHARLEEN